MKTVKVMVGTTKGLFFLSASASRTAWKVEGPHLAGRAIYSVAHDRAGRGSACGRARRACTGAPCSSRPMTGAAPGTSREEANVKFPSDSGLALKQIWQIEPGLDRRARTRSIAASTRPRSSARPTAARAWEVVARAARPSASRPLDAGWRRALPAHDRARSGERGPDVDRDLLGAASIAPPTAAIVDGAQLPASAPSSCPTSTRSSASACTRSSSIRAAPGACSPRTTGASTAPTTPGDSWKDIARGVPSDFGFAMAMHPHEPDTVYIIPIKSDQVRVSPDGKLRVYRTRNGGRSWEALTRGLPQRHAYDIVLRDGLTTDSLDPAGIYFGTRNGKLYASKDSGNSWRLAMDGDCRRSPACARWSSTSGSPRGARRRRRGERRAGDPRRRPDPDAAAAVRGRPEPRSRSTWRSTRPSLGDALDALWGEAPGVRDRVLTEQGEVRPARQRLRRRRELPVDGRTRHAHRRRRRDRHLSGHQRRSVKRMRYMLLVYRDDKWWDGLSVQEQGQDLPGRRRVQRWLPGEGRVPGRRSARADQHGHHREDEGRQSASHGRPLRRDQGAAGRLHHAGGQGPRRGARLRDPPPAGEGGPLDRGAAGQGGSAEVACARPSGGVAFPPRAAQWASRRSFARTTAGSWPR